MTSGERRVRDLALLAIESEDNDALAVLQDAVFEEQVDATECVLASNVSQADWIPPGARGADLLKAKRLFVAACIVDALDDSN